LTKSALVEATLACEIRATILGREKFHLSRQSFYPQAYGIACIKGAPYRHTIDALLVSWWNNIVLIVGYLMPCIIVRKLDE